MKKFIPVVILFALTSCNQNISVASDLSSLDSSLVSEPSLSTSQENSNLPSIESSLPSLNNDNSLNSFNNSIFSDASLTSNPQINNLCDVILMGEQLSEGESGEIITFKATYVKMINFDFNHYMLFVDETGFIYVYVNNNDYSTKLKNKTTNYSYKITGNLSKQNGNTIVNFQNIENDSDSEVKVDYSNIIRHLNSIEEFNLEANNILLDNKYNGFGPLVSIEGIIIALDESDANKKAVIYDGNQVLTIISDRKISDKTNIGTKFNFIGSLNIQSSHPALLLLESSQITAIDSIEISHSETVTSSYFTKWNLNSDVMKVPSYDDYAKIYTSTVYIKDDDSKSNAYYLGMVDNITDSLSDSGMGKRDVVKGAYLMNNLNKTAEEIQKYSPFAEYYLNEISVTFSYVLFNFNNSDHIWRVMPLDFTIGK